MVSFKKQKYLKAKLVRNFFYENRFNYIIFSHAGYLDSLEFDRISQYLIQQKVTLFKFPSQLNKRIFKDVDLLTLVSGPVWCFSCDNFSTVISFFNSMFVKKKIFPMYVLWDKKFYFYPYFQLNYEKHLVKFSQYRVDFFLLNYIRHNNKIVLTFYLLKIFFILNYLLKFKFK